MSQITQNSDIKSDMNPFKLFQSNPISANPYNLYLQSGVLGVARTLVAIPFEHPLEAIKTQWQAAPHLKSEYEVMKRIVQDRGWNGVYSGF